MTLSLFIAVFCVIVIAFVAAGVGVLFFGKTASHDACGRVPTLDTNECASQKAGLCPFEDKTGALKTQRLTRLTYPKV